MNAKFKRIRAMQLLKKCKLKEDEIEKYIAAFKLDCYDYARCEIEADHLTFFVALNQLLQVAEMVYRLDKELNK